MRSLKCAGFWKNRARIGQKIQCAEFKANSGGFRSENKMFRLFCTNPCEYRSEYLNMQILGQNWGFSWWNFYEEWNLDKFRTMVFFAQIFARFARFRTIFARPAFSRFFFRTDFRTFRAFLHDFRTNCLFKFFCSHVSRVFARSSHAGRRPACLCQIWSKSAQIWRRSLVSIGAPQIFEFLQRRTLTNWKWTHRNVLVICTVGFVLKLKILQTFWWFFWKTFWPT